jgi:putative copper resistance protein D
MEGMLINPLVIVRDFHLASTVVVAGIIFFDLFIASPLWRTMPPFRATQARFQSSTGKVLWISLAVSIASALAWLCLLAMRIGRKDLHDVISDGTVWLVLSQTQFGFAWQIRLLLGGLLAACLLLRGASGGQLSNGLAILAGLLAGAYLGSLAFAGHGAEGSGVEQNIHLVADFLHLLAASLWLGALIPLVLLLVYLGHFEEDGWISAAGHAASCFSTLGILAVGVLLVSGTINAAFLLGGMHSLIDSSYGRLLLFKIVLFGAMVCLAGINRQSLLPRLSDGVEAGPAAATVRRLVQSALVEIALGLAIVCIVGLLGIMPPANEIAAHLH